MRCEHFLTYFSTPIAKVHTTLLSIFISGSQVCIIAQPNSAIRSHSSIYFNICHTRHYLYSETFLRTSVLNPGKVRAILHSNEPKIKPALQRLLYSLRQ
jgi:hypothetical protein